VRISGRIAYRKVLGEKNPADLLTKHLGAEVIAKHVDTLNMIWVEGRAESAPTFDSVKSYLQTWVEDGADDHDYNYDYDNDIDEVTEETQGERRKVRFADLVSVRPFLRLEREGLHLREVRVPAVRFGSPAGRSAIAAVSSGKATAKDGATQRMIECVWPVPASGRSTASRLRVGLTRMSRGSIGEGS
jgi:hypothetical protein